MKILISERQFRVIQENKSENEIFVRKYYEKYKHIPRQSELAQLKTQKVGDVYPEHPRASSTISSWVKNFAPDFTTIANKIANEEDIIFKSKKRGATYISFDGKHRFESKFESLFYNIFALEGLESELIYESKEFLKECGKIPDFTWENKKIVVEIGGMEDEKYWSKLYDAESCISSQGYEVKIFNTRKDQKMHNFVEFYKKVCDSFGFEIRNDVVSDITKIMGFTEFTKQERQNEIDRLINKFDRTRGETDRLTNYVKQLGYSGIKQYKEKHDLSRFRDSETGIRQKVVELVKKQYKIDDIARILSSETGKNISSRIVDHNIKKAKELGELPQGAINKDYLSISKRKENYPSKDELGNLIKKGVSWSEMGRMYGVSDNAMKKRARSMQLI